MAFLCVNKPKPLSLLIQCDLKVYDSRSKSSHRSSHLPYHTILHATLSPRDKYFEHVQVVLLFLANSRSMLEIVSIKYKSIPVKKLFVLQRAYCLILSSQILVRIWGVLSWMPHSSVPFPRNFPTLSPPRSQAGHSSGNTTHLWKTWKTNYCIPPVSLTLSQELEMHMVFTKPKKNKPSNSESLLQALAQVLGSDARSNLEFNMWVGSNIHLSKNNGVWSVHLQIILI